MYSFKQHLVSRSLSLIATEFGQSILSKTKQSFIKQKIKLLICNEKGLEALQFVKKIRDRKTIFEAGIVV
jgi:hypothetical protein